MRPSNIQQYEFLHGTVLTALVRDGKNAVVRLVERPSDAAWAMYQINDAKIYIKGATVAKKQQRDKSWNWQFTFSKTELDAIKRESSNVVLVCAFNDIKTKEKMWRLLIEFDQMTKMVDMDNLPSQQTFEIKYVPGNRKVDVSYAAKQKIKIAPKAIFDWGIPGG